MEESDLRKERFQAITEKHRIQEHIRLKKLELDQEKLKLQHLKKKALREQWLLQDSASHNAVDFRKQQSLLSDQQQTRALQLKIHSIEMEILSLEREESMISTNESLILNRLKAVEKSPEELIKEVQDNFVPEPLQVTALNPESLSPLASNPPEPNTPRKTLFAMEINVAKNLLTGESTVLSTATVLPEHLNQHSGNKVYDDGRKCIYALNSEQGSHDLSCISELSASEVEQLLRSVTVHQQVNSHHSPRRGGHYLYSHQGDRDIVDRCDIKNHRGQYGNYVLSNNTAESDWKRQSEGEQHYCHQKSLYTGQEKKNNHHFGDHKEKKLHYGNQIDGPHSSCLMKNCDSVQKDCSADSFNRSNTSANGGRPSVCAPSPHQQEVVTAYQLQLGDYSSVNEEHYCYSHNQSTALFHGPTASDKVPSPLYEDDRPYTILNTLDTTEPITAIFMGFQAAEDDSGQNQEFVGSLKAELVIIEDTEQNGEDNMKKNHTQPPISSYSTGSAAGGNLGCVDGFGDRRTERQAGSGIRKMKKHKPCCSVC